MPSNDGFTPEQEACINRVVNEFLSNSKLLEWDGVKLQDHGYSITEEALITEEDLDCFQGKTAHRQQAFIVLLI